MGTNDDISPDSLRAELRRFAELILRLDGEGHLLHATPRILKLLGDLRSKLFAYEVRGTGRLAPPPPEAAPPGGGPGIVDDALRRQREAEAEWKRPFDPDREPD
ncbi:MAG: hypothetical protein HY561_07575 [Gemmatimonadetes bacterium]|nr:hypothetical protein [Gemmatimonadota bacterium]